MIASEKILPPKQYFLPENSTTRNHIEFDRTPSQQTALQLAAEANLAEVCSILLSEGIDFSAMDSR